MCVGSPTAGAWSSFQRRPDDEFETDRSALEQNKTHFNAAREKLEQWADDMVLSAEKVLLDTKE